MAHKKLFKVERERERVGGRERERDREKEREGGKEGGREGEKCAIGSPSVSGVCIVSSYGVSSLSSSLSPLPTASVSPRWLEPHG